MCIHIQTCTCIHMHIYTHYHICTHTHIHIHLYTYVYAHHLLVHGPAVEAQASRTEQAAELRGVKDGVKYVRADSHI